LPTTKPKPPKRTSEVTGERTIRYQEEEKIQAPKLKRSSGQCQAQAQQRTVPSPSTPVDSAKRQAKQQTQMPSKTATVGAKLDHSIGDHGQQHRQN
jgi:hypothetical protein